MNPTDFLADRRVRAPGAEGGTGGAALETPPPPAADDPAAAPADTGAAPVDTGAGAADTGAGADWWKSSSYTDAQRDVLVKKGLTGPDRDAALAKLTDMYAGAEKRLGAGPDKLMQKPADPAKLTEWMRANAEALGLPADVKGYEVADLTLPEGMDRNTELEGRMQQIAFEEGVPPAAYKKFVAAYAESMGADMAKINEDLAGATAKMETELKKDWGGEYPAKVLQAQQAFTALAQQANLDPDTQTAMFATLKEKGGDASVMRLMAAVGAMMGEDTLAQGGVPTLAKTPADARAEAARLRSPDGEFGKAYKEGNRQAMQQLMPRLSQLDKIAAGG